MPTTTFHRNAILAFAAVLACPTAAGAASLSPIGVIVDAAAPVKLVAFALVLAALAGVGVGGMKLASGPRLSGGSAFLRGLRLGGPLAGLVGAAYTGLVASLYLANTPSPATAAVLAPAVAEAMMLILLGLIAGAVAVISKALVEARIDQTVLNG